MTPPTDISDALQATLLKDADGSLLPRYRVAVNVLLNYCQMQAPKVAVCERIDVIKCYIETQEALTEKEDATFERATQAQQLLAQVVALAELSAKETEVKKEQEEEKSTEAAEGALQDISATEVANTSQQEIVCSMYPCGVVFIGALQAGAFLFGMSAPKINNSWANLSVGSPSVPNGNQSTLIQATPVVAEEGYRLLSCFFAFDSYRSCRRSVTKAFSC